MCAFSGCALVSTVASQPEVSGCKLVLRGHVWGFLQTPPAFQRQWKVRGVSVDGGLSGHLSRVHHWLQQTPETQAWIKQVQIMTDWPFKRCSNNPLVVERGHFKTANKYSLYILFPHTLFFLQVGHPIYIYKKKCMRRRQSNNASPQITIQFKNICSLRSKFIWFA